MKRLWENARQVPPVGFVADVVELYFVHRVSRSAAELAYFLLLTFFPILICVSAFVSKLNLEMSALLEEASYVLPQEVLAIFQDYLHYLDTHQSDAMLVAGVFMSALFASAAVRGLMNIMHEIYGRATFQGIFQLIASLIFSVLLLITIYLSITVVVTGNWFFRMVGQLLKLEDLVAKVDGQPVYALINGVVRGMLPAGLKVCKGMKSGDIDPRCEVRHCFTVSDKARAIGGGVLEGLLYFGKEKGLWND